jgi:hypothetical protein
MRSDDAKCRGKVAKSNVRLCLALASLEKEALLCSALLVTNFQGPQEVDLQTTSSCLEIWTKMHNAMQQAVLAECEVVTEVRDEGSQQRRRRQQATTAEYVRAGLRAARKSSELRVSKSRKLCPFIRCAYDALDAPGQQRTWTTRKQARLLRATRVSLSYEFVIVSQFV